MKYTESTITAKKLVLANDHYVAIPYDCTGLTAVATDGIIKAGTIIPSNDSNAIGVLFTDVDLNSNPNGTIIVHGFIKQEALPTAPTSDAVSALKAIVFMDKYNKPQPQKYSVSYDLNGATGTAVTDSSSPYTYGTSVTVKTAPTITKYPTGTTAFDKWNTKADCTGTSYVAGATLAISDNVKLYAIYKA